MPPPTIRSRRAMAALLPSGGREVESGTLFALGRFGVFDLLGIGLRFNLDRLDWNLLGRAGGARNARADHFDRPADPLRLVGDRSGVRVGDAIGIDRNRDF